MIRNRTRGFTIVELLIVIVVIGILAAITIVAYTSVQQKARNSSIINSAGQVRKSIQAYVASSGTYPSYSSGTGNICITADSGCVRDTAVVDPTDTGFTNTVASVASLPKSVARSGSVGYGIIYNFSATRTFNGNVQPAMIFYWLEGTAQKCGLNDVMDAWETALTASSGYTSANSASTGKTLCFVSIAGPSS